VSPAVAQNSDSGGYFANWFDRGQRRRRRANRSHALSPVQSCEGAPFGFPSEEPKPKVESMKDKKTNRMDEAMVRPRDAAVQLQISYPTIKQWIYHRKLRAVKTPGGHYRIPQSEVDRLLHRTRGHNEEERRASYQRISGRNQLVGRIVDVRISGLVAQVTLSVGGQLITSLITSGAVREMQLKKGQTVAALIKATEVMIIRV
jgi:molybdopterin-binding protein